MPLVAAAMMPHGFTVIPPLHPGGEGVQQTRRAMEEIGRRFEAAGVEAVVLVGPHGTRVDGAMCVMYVGRAAGSLTLNGQRAEMNAMRREAMILDCSILDSDLPNLMIWEEQIQMEYSFAGWKNYKERRLKFLNVTIQCLFKTMSKFFCRSTKFITFVTR